MSDVNKMLIFRIFKKQIGVETRLENVHFFSFAKNKRNQSIEIHYIGINIHSK